jgi:hypothetical protein
MFSCAAAANQWPPALSQYAPLSVARQSSSGQNGIELEIRNRIRTLPYYGVFDHIEYRVDGDIVTLSGQVVHPELRYDAKAAVHEIPGVRHVHDQIRFLTVSPSENEIRKAVFVAIYADPAFRPYALVSGGAIHIVVEGNHVTLEGEVSSEADRRLAALRASRAHGVFKVSSNITVSH